MKRSLFCWPVIFSFLLVIKAEAVTLAVQDANGSPGQTITVSVNIDDAKDLLAVDITLQYDNALLKPKEVKKTNLTSNFIIAYNAQGGEISIAIATAQALPGGSGSLVEVSFQIDDAAPLGTETFISISRVTLYNGTYQSMETTLQEGKVTVPCCSISPASNTVGPQGGSGSVNVTAGPNCSWTAFPTSGSEGWIGISSGASGTGNGTVSYSVAANANPSPRTGTLTIAGQIFTVTQNGTPCTYSISPTDRSHGPGAEPGTIIVTALAGCNWTAVSNHAWITVTSGASGSGNATVGYSVAANANPSPRTGTLTIAGATFTVTQGGSLFPIQLTSPSDQTFFDACSLYSLPTFAWSTTQTFKSYEIQFSSSDAFSLISVKVKTSATRVQISSSTWKKILLIPGVTGGSVYWRVVGSRADKTQATGNVSSILIEGAHEVENPQISSMSKGPLPTLSWINHCNMKFKVWFGNEEDFNPKATYTFSIKNPIDNEGSFVKILTSGQWKAIRKLVGDVSGSTIYWYVESWDGLGRYDRTEVKSFFLTD